jgi:non-specific serine/threonine protein kinase
MQGAGDERGVANVLDELGRLAQESGDVLAATPHLRAALYIRRRLGDVRGLVESLESVARLASVAGRCSEAVRLRGTAMAWRQAVGTPLAPIDQSVFDRDEDGARAALGEAGLSAGFALGRNRTVEEAIPDALAVLDDPTLEVAARREPATALPFGLTRREIDVLRLIVDGQTDGEIADALFIARRTVTTHVSHVLAKLDVSSRTAAAALAIQSGLA